MRLDKWLKVSRIIKRRTVANEAAGAGRVSINGKVAKPASEVKPGDTVAGYLPNLPEKVATEIPLLGTVDVSKGVISLRNDRGTSYDMYLQVQNELTAAIKEMRDDLSTARFGKKFADITEPQREALEQAIPVAISEAEPTKIGGK